MSLKFPTIRPETSEIVEPDDLNLNLKQFVDEINGNLTHENLSDFDLTEGMFEDDSFSEAFQSSFTMDGTSVVSNGFQCSKNSAGFIRKDVDGKKMPLIDFFANRDGYIIIDFSIAFEWVGSGLLSVEEADRFQLIEAHYPVRHDDLYWGTTSETNKLTAGGWLGASVSPALPEGSPNLLVATTTGHEVSPFTNINFPQGKWTVDANDRFAMKVRVLSNGNEICESGWIYNGTDKNSVFLTGVLPVRSGLNEIRTEIAAAMLVNQIGTFPGIRAKENGKKGKFFPKSFYSARNVAMPLPETRKPTADEISDSQVSKDDDIILGIDCYVSAANLVVQYRKA
tara:strand:+ start:42 stop:1061 length:1020 start_codon:yes stop_codon:yes gene_type:complete